MNSLRRTLLVAGSTLSVFLPQLGTAQAVSVDAASLMRRLDAIEQRLRVAEGQRPAVAQPVGQAAAATYAYGSVDQRMSELERESSQQTGNIERLQFAIEKIAKRVDDLARDVDLRFSMLEKQQVAASGAPAAGQQPVVAVVQPQSAAETPSPAISGTSAPAAASGTAPVAVPANISATDLYNKAYIYLTATDYPNARTWLEEFLKRYPQDKMADNAWYWLGEVQLVQNNPSGAVISFRNGLKYFPKGAKAPAHLFKMGVALEQLKQPEMAKGAWHKLIKDYPSSPEAARAKEKLTGLKG